MVPFESLIEIQKLFSAFEFHNLFEASFSSMLSVQSIVNSKNSQIENVPINSNLGINVSAFSCHCFFNFLLYYFLLHAMHPAIQFQFLLIVHEQVFYIVKWRRAFICPEMLHGNECFHSLHFSTFNDIRIRWDSKCLKHFCEQRFILELLTMLYESAWIRLYWQRYLQIETDFNGFSEWKSKISTHRKKLFSMWNEKPKLRIIYFQIVWNCLMFIGTIGGINILLRIT